MDELQSHIQKILDADSDDFLELARILGRDFKTDYAGADLAGVSFEGKDLAGADLAGCNLRGANLSKTNLSGADLTQADLSNADLRGANLTNTDLTGADLTGTLMQDEETSDSVSSFWEKAAKLALRNSRKLFRSKVYESLEKSWPIDENLAAIGPALLVKSPILRTEFQAFTAELRAFGRAVPTASSNQIKLKYQEHLSRRIKILGVDIDNLSVEEFLQRLQKGIVFTPNVDHLMQRQRDPEFAAAYAKADFRVCDSQILMYAAKFLGTSFKAKISGADLFPMFCEHHRHNNQIRIFLLGGAKGVPQMAQANINARIGRNIIVAAYSPSFGFEKDEAECQQILDMIRQSSATVLVVGLGAPKQEKWIAKYHEQLPNIDIFMGVGAAVDFEAGNKSRVPQIVSKFGFEWLYRLVSEPKRLWKRYLLQDMPFFWLLLKQKKSRPQSER